MVMVAADGSSLEAASLPKMANSWLGGPVAPRLYSSNELGELSQ